MIVLDTSVAVAFLDRRDRRHRLASAWYSSAEDDLATTPLVLAEIDYLVTKRLPPPGRVAFHGDLRAGAYGVTWWGAAVRDAVAVVERYADLAVSLADASLVALASRLGTTEIATFDERHFRAMQPLSHGTAFTVLPADA